MAHTIVPTLHSGKMVFCVVIHDEGMERIRVHDPAVVTGDVLAQAIRGRDLLLSNIDVLICYEADAAVFADKCKELDFNGELILQYLCRNWQNFDRDKVDPFVIGRTRS